MIIFVLALPRSDYGKNPDEPVAIAGNFSSNALLIQKSSRLQA